MLTIKDFKHINIEFKSRTRHKTRGCGPEWVQFPLRPLMLLSAPAEIKKFRLNLGDG